MRSDVRHDLSRSAHAFLHNVWPHIKDHLQGGELLPVESTNSGYMRNALDILAGIDAWQLCHAQQRMRSIASRVQCAYDPYTGRPYCSFTIRKSRPGGGKTELDKRLEALRVPRQGWELPALTIQAYMTEQTFELLDVAGIVYTRDLYEFIDRRGIESFRTIRNVDGSSTFIAVFWRELDKALVRVKRLKHSDIATTTLGVQLNLFEQHVEIR